MSVVDRLLDGVVGEESERLDRRRILVLGSWASAGAATGFTVHRFLMQPEPGWAHLNVGTSAVFMFLIPLFMRVTGRYRAAAHLLLTGLSAMVFVDALLLGGTTAASVYAMLVTPLMAGFYLGRSGAVGYGVVQAVLLQIIYFATVNQWIPEPALDPANANEMHLNGATGILAFIVIFTAVYDSERQAAARRQSALVENLVDGVVEVDLLARVRTANHQAVELLGEDLPMGASVNELLDGSVGELVIRAWHLREVQRTDIELDSGRVLLAQVGPILTDGGGHDGAVLVLRDITHEREVDRMKTDFISTVSHELRTPMTSVLGFTKLIRSNFESRVLPAVDPDDARAAKAIPKIQRNLEIIATEGERLTSMINDVLDIAKMESGSMEWHRSRVVPADLAQRAVDATTGLFQDSPVVLQTEVADDLPELQGDEHRLLQVLINLVANAAKFTDEGSVTLRVDRYDEAVRFSVIDTGPGIAPDGLARIFDRFHQVSDSVSDKPKGTGLGLAIAREIAAAHSGSLSAESTVGQGSAFHFVLPPPGSAVPNPQSSRASSS